MAHASIYHIISYLSEIIFFNNDKGLLFITLQVLTTLI